MDDTKYPEPVTVSELRRSLISALRGESRVTEALCNRLRGPQGVYKVAVGRLEGPRDNPTYPSFLLISQKPIDFALF